MDGVLWVQAKAARAQLVLGSSPGEHVVELPPVPPDESVFEIRAFVAGQPTQTIPAVAGEYRVAIRGWAERVGWELTGSNWSLVIGTQTLPLVGTGERRIEAIHEFTLRRQ